jgi:hypothetical protein
MSSRVGPVAFLLAAGLGLLAVGCGRKDRPPLARVSGTVTHNGKAVAKAAVVFYPEQEGGIRSAMGETDDQGRYTLWTYDPGDGAPVGKHKVTVTLRGTPEKAEMHPSMKSKEKGEAYYDQVASTGRPLLPEKYFNAMTSGLTADVQAGKNNTFDFPLTGEVPKKP